MSQSLFSLFRDTKISEFYDISKSWGTQCSSGYYKNNQLEGCGIKDISDREKATIIECFNKIQQELEYPIDKHTKRLISRNIELLLDYCLRFYERQFITRFDADNEILAKFERLLNEYFEQNLQQDDGIPTVKYFADKICLSPSYFGDYFKKSTGRTAQDYIQNKVIDLAKEMILATKLSVSQIAYELGFQYSQHFSRVFKNSVGVTPNEYRMAN